jgi:hypothetical protein
MIYRQVKEDTLFTLQTFVVLMYNHSSVQANVKATRQVLFVKTSMEAVLKQQAEYQYGCVWT